MMQVSTNGDAVGDAECYDSIAADVDGSFEGGLYSGTLENGGVGIAPYHEFEDSVPDDLYRLWDLSTEMTARVCWKPAMFSQEPLSGV